MILSDLHALYHPPTTQAPLQVDEEKTGKDSDHDIIIFAPKSDSNFKVVRKKKIVKTRPLPESKIPLFGRDIQAQSWNDVINEDNVDIKAFNFHRTIIDICSRHFPEKSQKISSLDKKWITPYLKNLSRKIKTEFFRNRKKCQMEAIKTGMEGKEEEGC